jgi:hypothetical protein
MVTSANGRGTMVAMSWRGDGILLDLSDHDRQGSALVWMGQAPGQQLVEHDRGGVHVGRGRDLTPFGLFGRHIDRRAHDLASLRGQALASAGHLGEAEVGDLELPLLREQQVLRLHVAVQHPLLVGVVQAGTGRHRHGTGGLLRKALL